MFLFDSGLKGKMLCDFTHLFKNKWYPFIYKLLLIVIFTLSYNSMSMTIKKERITSANQSLVGQTIRVVVSLN